LPSAEIEGASEKPAIAPIFSGILSEAVFSSRAAIIVSDPVVGVATNWTQDSE
jgi:hypothetical protein